MVDTTSALRDGLTLADARAERDAVLAALTTRDDTWLDRAGTEGLDTREMALVDDLNALEELLTTQRSA
ncbi:hypothetical protein [Ruania halotolerans]|uniref:hypothetical protein n=1 Tax=Ruania halotolerans TaxID=2897773 RepID=UPI001E5EE8E9|nr:hypothetical protein [Ruania halotolerans]UFU06846.1 hypothetical protein LQF10_01655 [Ruania halotolerans]